MKLTDPFYAERSFLQRINIIPLVHSIFVRTVLQRLDCSARTRYNASLSTVNITVFVLHTIMPTICQNAAA